MSQFKLMDIGLGLEDTHVVITGAAGLIGSEVCRAFISAGCKVSGMDISYDKQTEDLVEDKHGPARALNLHVDISNEESVVSAFRKARSTFGPVSTCVALAALDLSVLDHHESSTTLTAEQWRRAIDVNVTGTFLTAREWLCGLESHTDEGTVSKEAIKNVALIIVGSESGRFGERTNAAYSTSKSAVQGGLMLSFAADAPRVWGGAR